MSFEHRIPVRLARTDQAGVLFFAEQLALCHEAYEALLDSLGFPLRRVLGEMDWGLPIVHCEATLTRPVRVGDQLTIVVDLARAGTTSFTLRYALCRGEEEVGTGSTTHVCVDRQSAHKRPLDEALRTALVQALSG